MKIKIGTRGSKLALTQTEYVMKRLLKEFPEHEYEIVIIKTKGDIINDRPLNQIGDKGLFVNEIEERILSDEIQMGVHSMKDMPAEPADGLTFSKLWDREDFRDVLILREKKSLKELPINAVIATGSARRARQLKNIRPDLQIVDIRGNVDTRLRKMEEQKLDGIVLAAAGIKRLGLEHVITEYLEPDIMIPAPAQGILAMEVRSDNEELLAMLNKLHNPVIDVTGRAERQFLKEIGADCHVPVGAVCESDGKELTLRTVYGRKNGEKLYYAVAKGDNPEEIAKKAADEIRNQMAGTVYLVGGGPGDEGLITVKGMELIKKADCIVYDRLSSPALLSYAKEGCEKIYVGKADHHHTMKQEDINRLLVNKSLEYDTVVRLKGGDSYVFGRGGEEALTLRECGVPFQVIPGVTSATAGPAYAGIPITHRGIAGGFRVVTAHNKKDELADIDFKSMADSNETLVFLMGLSKLGEIADKLIAAGKDKKTAAAVISQATTPFQKTVVSDLEHIYQMVCKSDIISPALIIVGDVVKLHDKLSFFEKKPLYGRRYIVTKIGSRKSGLSQMLREKGAHVFEVQTGRIEYTGYRIDGEALKKADWIVFTSTNGIDGFFDSLFNSGMDTRKLGGCRIAVIGEESRKQLLKYGVKADIMPEIYSSDGLSMMMEDILKRENKIMTVWHPSAVSGAEALQEKLGEICDFIQIPVYENAKVNIDTALLDEYQKFDGIFFTCASSAERFAEAFGKDFINSLRVISIGTKCTDRLKSLGIENIIQSDKASYSSMIEKAE